MKKILFPVVCALIAAVLLLSAPVSSPPAAAESMTMHFDDGAAVWTECEGATNYVVSVADADGGEVLRATVSSSTLFYPLSDLLAAGGEYTVTVTAYSDATPVATASASFAHTVTLASPALSFADGTLSWSALAGSSGYAVALNGVDLGTVTTTSVYLADIAVAAGSYTVSVIALGDEFNLPSSPAELTFSVASAPFPPYDALLAETDGRRIVTWTVPEGETPKGYVYELFSDDKLLSSGECVSNGLDVTELTAEGGSFLLRVRTVAGDRVSAAFSFSFEVTDGGAE